MKLHGPPGFSVEPYVGKLQHSAMRSNASWRRRMCATSPILFGLYYLRAHLTLPDGRGGFCIALAEFHIELAMSAKRWMGTDLAPKEIRDAWVAPREMGKSSWIFLILALWAMAYGHRKFICVYSDTEARAKEHLDTLRLELSQNERLARDFPDLCAPLRVDGRAVMNNSGGYLAANGSAIVVKGMNSATLGVKLRERRPDALFFDDIEPKEGNYSADQKAKRLTDLIEAIFPCNYKAVVQIVGTTVMHGSIIHDIIQGADWVAAENIEVHHFRGIVEDSDTGVERSCWPAKWTLEFLLAERAGKQTRRSFAKNFENEPIALDGTYWDDEDIVYDAAASALIDDRILIIDPAAKSKKTNDETGIAMLGFVVARQRVVLERVMGVRLKPTQLRELVHSIVRKNRIRLIVVDVTNGGDHVVNTLSPLPAGVKILPVPIKRSKADRFTDLLDLYQRGQVVHARPIPGVESQMKAYPHVAHDDRIDAVALGKEYFFGELDLSRMIR